MAFRLNRDESVEEGLKRILLEQIDKAEEELASGAPRDLEEAIHQGRKRCKKARAVYRLTRAATPDAYRRENHRFRDAARNLSAVRDADAMLEAYDSLLERFQDEIESRQQFAQIRRRLTMRRKEIVLGESDANEKVDRLRGVMREGREAVSSWTLERGGFKTLRQGIVKTYRRGREAMRDARKTPTNQTFHEWRKRAKYLAFQVGVVRGLWPKVMRSIEKELKTLADLLGDDHDLALLGNLLQEDLESLQKVASVDAFSALLERRRTELQQAAFRIGERVYATKPKRLDRKMKQYWKRWRR